MGFWENPELLFGVPLVAIGVIGALIALSALAGAPAQADAEGGAAAVHAVGHPGEMEYVRIGIILAVITAVEVALYVEFQRELLIALLIVLSAAKFILVVAWFMHLKFDSRIFTTAFVGGFLLAAAAFTVILATLGSNIV